MQKANHGGLKKKAAAIAALLLAAATAVGGTLAYKDYKQHKSNEFSGSQIKYEARLVEDFEEVFDWKVGEDIKKEIRVANVGKAEAGYGDVYVRLQLKEFMQIGDMVFKETEERYMVANGRQTFTASSGKTYTFEDGHYVIFGSETEAKGVFPNSTVKYLEDKVTGETGYFIETKKGDFNGQYGKHVVVDYGFGEMAPVIPGSVFCPVDERNHHGYTDPATGEFIIWSKECDYPVHPWNDADGPQFRSYIKQYIEWVLGDDIIFLSDWDGKPVAAWIIDDGAVVNPAIDGWAYWGQALAPETTTSNILEKVLLIDQPDGNFYYVIHTDMQALSIDEFLKPDGEGKDWKTKVKDSYVNNRPSITWNGPNPATVKAGEFAQSAGVTVGPEGAAQGPLTWTTSNPNIATVDQNGKVKGVAPGIVTIIVKAPNGAREQYSVTVTPGDPVNVPVDSVSLDKGSLDLAPGGGGKLTATVNPSDATNKNVSWSSSNTAVATVDANGNVTAVGEGAATITVTTEDGGKKAVCTVTVEAEAPKQIPTKDDKDTFDMFGSDNDDLNCSVVVTMSSDDFDHPVYDVDPGSVKLSDIIKTGAGGYTGNINDITVTAIPETLNSKVSIGPDKDTDRAILITYYGEKTQWDAANTAVPGSYPAVQMTLVLHAPGYADTVIKVNLTFNCSLYI